MKPAREKNTTLKTRYKQSEFDFSSLLISWQKQYGRHNLPWQKSKDPYRVWLSEIMLQQTQVATVIPYYDRFLTRFPNIETLADASIDSVMAEWSGLGYYSRARNLHQCANLIVQQYGGIFPSEPNLLEKLPGIGRSTAAAIAVFSFGKRAAILDGNVIRVFSRIFGIDEYAGNKAVKDRLWELAESLLPEKELASYTQGLMDLGATVCVRSKPSCHICPFSRYCHAFREGKTAELPTKKPVKKLSEKQVFMLVFIKENKVLLEKRPASGIWGGLLSFPELTNFTSSEVQKLPDKMRFLEKVRDYEVLESFTHTFTHFKLQVTPVLINFSKKKEKQTEESYIWYALENISEAPLPSPVKKLLKKIQSFL